MTDHLDTKEVWETKRPLCDGSTARIVVFSGPKVKEVARSGEQRTEVVELQSHESNKAAEKKLTRRDVASIIDAPITNIIRTLLQKLAKARHGWAGPLREP